MHSANARAFSNLAIGSARISAIRSKAEGTGRYLRWRRMSSLARWIRAVM
jgi:hypothetical protein